MSEGLWDRLERHALERPGALAVSDAGERRLDWRGLRDAVVAGAARLGPEAAGSTLLVGAGNRIELLVALLSGLRAGATVLPVPPELPALELAELARTTRVAHAVGEPEVLRALDAIAPRATPIEAFFSMERSGAAPAARADGSMLLKTSGTTGAPRLARRDLPALEAVGRGSAGAIGVGPGDAMLLAVPLYHSYGIDQGLLTATMAGCALELQRGFEPMRARAALLQREITLFPGVPLMFDALARQSTPPGAPPRLRRAYSAGSPLPRRVFDAFASSYGARLGQIYGATEFGSVTWNDPNDADFEPGSVGRPLDGVALRVVAAPGAAADEGQLAVSAPSLLREFLDGPPLELDDGFLLTGDLARLDASGQLFLTGRVRLLVDVGGIKVNPLEVEAVLARHPAVRDAVVVPVRVSDLTARLKAVIEPEPGQAPTKAELRRFAREHLVHYKVPRSFEIRSALPRSPAGKILRKELEAGLAPGT